jgi:plasmid stabilization system protein ParE
VAQARPVVWSEPALSDLEAAHSYFFERSPAYATAFLDAVEAAADSLSAFPGRGRQVPELELPELIVEKHRLVYETAADRVIVVRLIHGKRDFKTTWTGRP